MEEKKEKVLYLAPLAGGLGQARSGPGRGALAAYRTTFPSPVPTQVGLFS